ncbi:MAG: O-phosphoserine--tRNA ligase [Methanobacteriota archaeon]|nr:MAG: O-phosphoserine--tRNA ligase [Euryarchaeota archaeon]
MGLWNAKKIADAAKKDFERTWNETKDLAMVSQKKGKSEKAEKGKPHVIYETLSRLREAYLNMGFEEVINPLFIEDTEVHKQFGPEAVTVLDRVYYLGGLPRPDIGISEKKLEELKRINAGVDKSSLERVLRLYKKGEISGDDLTSELASVLNTDDTTALKALDSVFPEFKELKPLSSNMTLRSHMTSGWFLTLEALYGRESLPVRLFSIDRCFRREQKEDRGHLRTYYSASSVVMGEDVSLQDGEEIAKELLSGFGFRDFRFAPDEKRSKYYAPDTQTEVFGLSPGGEWVEIATFGMYSPVALSRYGIEHPVLNLGLGVERLAMVLSGAEDIRELVYPQFYGRLMLSDAEIAKGIAVDRAPETEEGRAIAQAIVRTAAEHRDEPSPCSFEAYNGSVLGRNVKVSIVEVEEGTRLLGPAALNEVRVYEGSVYGVAPDKSPPEVLEKGTSTGITYLQALADLAAREIEEAAREGRKEAVVRVKGVKLPSDINLKVSEAVARFITSQNKKIDIRGPVFTTVKAVFS